MLNSGGRSILKLKESSWVIHIRKWSGWLEGIPSYISVHNKLLLYKQILKPIWSYGIQLWGCSASSNIKIIQVFQNKVLRNIVRAPWYCRDADIHRDLRINTVVEEKSLAAEKHKLRLSKHSNRLASRLLQGEGVIRRLKRIKPLDLTLRLCNFSIWS